MKRKIINTLLVLVVVAAVVWCSVSKGLQWFIGFIPMLAAVYGLVGLNTNYLKEY